MDELNKLNAKVSSYDKALFFWHKNGELHGILVVHVDDFLWSGSNGFVSHVIELLKKIFKISREHESAFQYIGLNVKQENQAIIVDQMNYIQSIQPINIDRKRLKHKDLETIESEKHQLCALLVKLNWVATMSRPEISFHVSQVSGVQSKSKVSDLLKPNKILRVIKNDSLKIKFVKLDLSNIKLAVYYDASFANLKDGGSQGGFIIFLCDGLQNCCPIAWSSKCIKCVVCSTLAAETLAGVESLDTAFLLSSIIGEILGNKKEKGIEMNLFTDNKSLFDAINTTNVILDKCLRVDVAALREMHEQNEFMLHWTECSQQLADALTKKGASKTKLLQALESSKLSLVENPARILYFIGSCIL